MTTAVKWIPDAHVNEALIPSLDDLSGTKSELEGLVTVVGAIELLSSGVEGTLGISSVRRADQIQCSAC